MCCLHGLTGSSPTPTTRLVYDRLADIRNAEMAEIPNVIVFNGCLWFVHKVHREESHRFGLVKRISVVCVLNTALSHCSCLILDSKVQYFNNVQALIKSSFITCDLFLFPSHTSVCPSIPSFLANLWTKSNIAIYV